MADLFELLLGTGMRRGESLGLHWTDVHLAERMLLVRWSLTAVNNNHLYLGHPKTKASRNWVSLAPRAVAALERQAALARAGQPKGTPLEGLVFCRPDGSPLRPQGVLVELRRRADELGLPRIGVHDLRRTAATIMISSRVPLGSVFKDHRIVDHGWVIRRHELTDQEWGILAPLIPRAVTGRPRVSDRQVINGMVYKIRTGISWRDLPERYGPWQTVYTRFRRYALDGVFTRALQQIQARADAAGDIDWLVQIDSTIVRAHQHAAATGRKGGSTGRTNQTITPSVDPEEA
ncbi:IS5 family transposase [Streptomyces antimycoticus]|uniref:IS5 family transposase n=1 Tax=Streptomyces antimycoticus TaxID=68175 RepID=UPI003F4DEA25